MTRFPMSLFTDAISLDQSSTSPLHRQLYKQVRQAIVNGRLAAGTRLPSSRLLASVLGVSRNTVQSAFAELVASGYAEGRAGSGTFVAESVRLVPPARTRPVQRFPRFSSRGAHVLAREHTPCGLPAVKPLMPYIPAPDAINSSAWPRLVSRQLHAGGRHLPGYAPPTGFEPLREAIALYLRATRGVSCSAEQVIVAPGWQQAFALAIPLLVDPGEVAWVEDPGCQVAWRVLKEHGARVVPVPVDDQGLDVAAGRAGGTAPRAVYVAPACQQPLGAIMSYERRVELLDWASCTNAWVVEDDSDSIFQLSGLALPPLFALDNDERVIHLCSFSKILFPMQNLTALVVPPRAVDLFTTARALSDQPTASYAQAALADFILDGHLAQHIRHVRSLYAQRQNILVDALTRRLGSLIEVGPARAGLHLVGRLHPDVDDQEVARLAAAQGVLVGPLSTLSALPTKHNGIQIGFAPFSEMEITQGAQRLAVAIERVSREPGCIAGAARARRTGRRSAQAVS